MRYILTNYYLIKFLLLASLEKCCPKRTHHLLVQYAFYLLINNVDMGVIDEETKATIMEILDKLVTKFIIYIFIYIHSHT